MRRGWIGLGLLLLLLAGGSLSAWAMVQWNTPLEEMMEEAAQCATASDWQQAEALSGQAKAIWDRQWQGAAVFADHAPMEEIDGLFAQLEVYGQARDPLGYGSLCRILARKLGAMGDAHIPNWWNLL